MVCCVMLLSNGEGPVGLTMESTVMFTSILSEMKPMQLHCLRALRILNLTGVILRHLLPVMHKSGT